ncbi:MAG: AAA family ATPase [Clostridia bacterium]|nr:AAA family ATPase [Clostridia bacterium]
MTNKIKELLSKKDFILIAIDGRCGAGKTTLAEKLGKEFSANVIHMDDFFLRPEQRTEKRLLTPGENIDHERFLNEVLIPLSENKSFSYRPFNCKTQSLSEPISIIPSKVTVIEGSYSCHPQLWDFYDLHIFVDTDCKTQLERIEKRNGEEIAKIFKNKWIPLEESYFKEFNIKESCEIKEEN